MLGMACRVCVAAILGALAAMPVSAAGIATVTDVVNDGYRRPPGDRERRAAPSDELVSDEALRTDRESSIAVKFVDGSELSVESQSEVVLSDYLFDPNAAAATGIINLNTGLFHFVSNNVPDSGIVLKTPVATIGIRGTEFLVHVDGEDATIIDVLDGKLEVKPLKGGKPVTCEGGQSILVESARSDARCGDLGAFATAAAAPTPKGERTDSGNDKERTQESHSAPSADRAPDPGPSDPGGGDPGGGLNDKKGNGSGQGGSDPGAGGGNGGGSTGDPGPKK